MVAATISDTGRVSLFMVEHGEMGVHCTIGADTLIVKEKGSTYWVGHGRDRGYKPAKFIVYKVHGKNENGYWALEEKLTFYAKKEDTSKTLASFLEGR